MRTPCYLNGAFHGTLIAQRRVKKKCCDCPVTDLCLEVGIGEPDGVYGGTDATDLIRKTFRATVDKATMCPNGHLKSEYEVEIEGPGHQELPVCGFCAGLHLRIAEVLS